MIKIKVILAGMFLIITLFPVTISANINGAQYFLSINEEEMIKSFDPLYDDIVQFTFTVSNVGDNLSPPCVLNVSGLPSNWSYNFTPEMPLIIQQNMSVNVTLSIYPDEKTQPRDYALKIKGEEGVQCNEIQVVIKVISHPIFDVISPPHTKAKPGDIVTLNFEIINRNNYEDKYFLIEINCSESSWEFIPINGSWTDYAEPGGKVYKNIKVQIPVNQKTTKGTDGINITVKFSSEKNESVVRENWTIIHIIQIYAFNITILPKMMEVSPSEKAEFNISIENLGNGEDIISLYFGTTFQINDWIIYFDEKNVSVDAYSKTYTNFIAIPGKNVLEDEYLINIYAKSSGPEEHPIEHSEKISIIVKKNDLPNNASLKILTPSDNSTLFGTVDIAGIFEVNTTEFKINVYVDDTFFGNASIYLNRWNFSLHTDVLYEGEHILTVKIEDTMVLTHDTITFRVERKIEKKIYFMPEEDIIEIFVGEGRTFSVIISYEMYNIRWFVDRHIVHNGTKYEYVAQKEGEYKIDVEIISNGKTINHSWMIVVNPEKERIRIISYSPKSPIHTVMGKTIEFEVELIHGKNAEVRWVVDGEILHTEIAEDTIVYFRQMFGTQGEHTVKCLIKKGHSNISMEWIVFVGVDDGQKTSSGEIYWQIPLAVIMSSILTLIYIKICRRKISY